MDGSHQDTRKFLVEVHSAPQVHTGYHPRSFTTTTVPTPSLTLGRHSTVWVPVRWSSPSTSATTLGRPLSTPVSSQPKVEERCLSGRLQREWCVFSYSSSKNFWWRGNLDGDGLDFRHAKHQARRGPGESHAGATHTVRTCTRRLRVLRLGSDGSNTHVESRGTNCDARALSLKRDRRSVGLLL